MKTELAFNPCPYCFEADVEVTARMGKDGFTKYSVWCRQCHAVGALGENPDEAVMKWNSVIGETEEGLGICPFCPGYKFLRVRLLVTGKFGLYCWSCGASGPDADSLVSPIDKIKELLAHKAGGD